MKYTVTLRRNSDGKVVTFQDDFDLTQDDVDFIWSEGNWSCDCNRHLDFCRVLGQDGWETKQCGHRAYTCLSIVDDETGEEFYGEVVPDAEKN